MQAEYFSSRLSALEANGSCGRLDCRKSDNLKQSHLAVAVLAAPLISHGARGVEVNWAAALLMRAVSLVG